ncbi:MAG: helix-turn-helix transcriptional regulator [Nitrospiraceae bacterium]|nr:helix-turn-helix transcriptional regulator [Nitrospiraceae bacterium]
MEMFEHLGETLRRLRKERRKTLSDLGREAQVGKGQLSRIENGLQEATLGTLSKILDAHGVSRQEFFRRYDLVEAEANAVAAPHIAGRATSRRVPEPQGNALLDEVRDALRTFDQFLDAAFDPRHPVAHGALEFGEYVVYFRLVSRDSRDGSTSANPL